MMCKVDFDSKSSTFILSKGGESTPYYYYPNSKNIWDNLSDDAFHVVVLNNPFLHRETDIFELQFDGSEERGGFIFPISLLESEESESKQLLSYMFVAYRVLLSRIKGEPTGVLSDSYKEAFVLVVHKETVPYFILEDYLLSLAKLGFYYYSSDDSISFPYIQSIDNHPRTIGLNKTECDNFGIGYVKDLVEKRLNTTSDFLTRFVLVYQVIELYISEIHHKLLDLSIEEYRQKKLNKNDFGEELKIISREAYQIKTLVNGLGEEEDCIIYKREVMSLFNDIGYKPRNESLETLLYSLRNQIFHNYGIFIGHEDALNQVIFRFENVVLLLLSKRLINNSIQYGE